MKKNEVIAKLNEMKNRDKRISAWEKGVYEYAFDILEPLDDCLDYGNYQTLLNGAPSWTQYSLGGCALIYSDDIAKRMCTPSEYKRYLSAGENSKLSSDDYWMLDVQVRALYRAMSKIRSACRYINTK